MPRRFDFLLMTRLEKRGTGNTGRLHNHEFLALICVLAFCLCLGCNRRDLTRPEYDYDAARITQELHRLEQMSKLEDALGHDTRELKEMLRKRSSAKSVREMQDLLVRCRDEYLRGLKDKSGVPFGGIGAGTVELWTDGGLHDWRIGENWDEAKEPEFSYFAVRTNSPHRDLTSVRVLENSSWAGRMGTRDIQYDGQFPFVFLDYGSGGQPVSIKAEVFSAFIPHNAEDSSLPLACFKFILENTSDEEVDVSMIFAVGISPLIGKGAVSFEQAEGISTASYESGRDMVALSTVLEKSSYAANWPDGFLPLEFSRTGRLGGSEHGDNGRMAVCGEFNLKAHESGEALFLLSWFFPDFKQRPSRSHKMELKFKELGTTQEAEAGKYFGRRYNRFGSAKGVAHYFVQNLARLEGETRLWHEIIYKSTLDDWLKHFLSNSLYPLFKSSFWTENGLFNILESTNGAPNLDCIHVRYYGSVPLALMFPELDKQVLRRLARYRGPFGGEAVGLIPEQFYGLSLELPFGRPLLQNNLVFVLMVYRDYLWTGDSDFLSEMWPAVEEAMALAASADTDSDGLPDDTGIEQSYDDYDMGDSSAYISGIWLASLRAAEEIALAMDRPESARGFHDTFVESRQAMEQMLWLGEYYAFTEGERAKVCFADALNGQWYADMLGLGDLLDSQRIRSSIESIFKYNYPATSFGIVNGFLPGHGIDFRRHEGFFQNQSGSIWTGATFAVASLGLYRGFYDEPMGSVREVYENYSIRLGNLWNLRETNDPESGLPMAYPYYYRAMSLWAVLLGVEGFRYDAPGEELTISPSKKTSDLKAPLVVPGALGEMEFHRDTDGIECSISIQRGSLHLKRLRLPGDLLGRNVRHSVQVLGKLVDSKLTFDGDKVVVTAMPMQKIGAMESLKIKLERQGDGN